MAARQKGKAPISRHPAFPAIVALWFAALLGLGSLVLPIALFEALARATGIASVVPAAEPPLGVTARIAIALAAAALGAFCGLFIARRVANAQATVAQPRPEAATKRAMRPISASEELGSESLDAGFGEAAAPAFIGRRRALSVTDESGRSPWLDTTDLPHDEPVALDAMPAMDAIPDLAPAAELELELDQVADAPEPVEAAQHPFEAPAAFHDPAGPAIAVPELDAAPAEAPAPAPYDEEPEAMTDTFDPRPFAEPHAAPADAHEPEADAAPLADEAAAKGLAERRPDELSMAELLERFALSLRTAAERREEAAANAATPAEPAPAPEPEAEAETVRYVPDLGVAAEPAPRFVQELADSAGATPRAMQPVEFGDEPEDEDVVASLSLPLSTVPRPFAPPTAGFAAPCGADEPDEDAADDGFSSLLDLRSRLGSEHDAVRIDEPETGDDFAEAIEPAVVFPGQEQRRATPSNDGDLDTEPPHFDTYERPFDAPGRIVPPARSVDASQAEHALRDALNKLQRMSGAV